MMAYSGAAFYLYFPVSCEATVFDAESAVVAFADEFRVVAKFYTTPKMAEALAAAFAATKGDPNV